MTPRILRAWCAWSLAAAVGLAMAACQTSRAPGGSVGGGGALQVERDRVAASQAEAAKRDEAAGRLHDALWRWRVVEAVARDPVPARTEAARLEGRAASQAQTDVARGQAEHRARNDAAASASYQAALLVAPRQPAAIAGLREIDTARVLGQVAQEQSAARHARPRRRAAKHK